MIDPAQLGADLELAVELADEADAITMQRFRAGDLLVESKPDLTPVSDADRAVEEQIRAVLLRRRPADAFFGEESSDGDSRGLPAVRSGTGTQAAGSAVSSARRWVIDPIDGTKNYVRGVPIWATLIALLVDDEPVIGMVSAPGMATRWWASAGGGAYVRDPSGSMRRLCVSNVSRLADASLAYASLPAWRKVGRYQQFLGLLDTVWRSRGYGDFYSYMLLADGAVDVVAEPELSLWDMAALAPIVTEAGGRFAGLNAIDGVHQANAIATNGFLLGEALSVIGTSPAN